MREVELPINQNLLVLDGADPKGIRTVYFHKQSVVQGEEWLVVVTMGDAEDLPTLMARMVKEKMERVTIHDRPPENGTGRVMISDRMCRRQL